MTTQSPSANPLSDDAPDSDDHVWLIYGGMTYHVPMSYVRRHPRGEKLILPHANQDITAAYDAAGHTKGAMRTLKKYADASLTVDEVMARHAALCEAQRQATWNLCVRVGSVVSVMTVLGAVYMRYRSCAAS